MSFLEEVSRGETDYIQLYNQKNVDQLINKFEKDAIIISPDGEAFIGIDQIKDLLSRLVQKGELVNAPPLRMLQLDNNVALVQGSTTNGETDVSYTKVLNRHLLGNAVVWRIMTIHFSPMGKPHYKRRAPVPERPEKQ